MVVNPSEQETPALAWAKELDPNRYTVNLFYRFLRQADSQEVAPHLSGEAKDNETILAARARVSVAGARSTGCR